MDFHMIFNKNLIWVVQYVEPTLSSSRFDTRIYPF